ncbi:MAG: lysophospholipid acyltransferase family protein [Acidimicrobiales bacterium]
MKPTAHHEQFVRTGRWCARLAAPLAKLDLPDQLTVPTRRPVLFAGNHRSFFDVIATLAIFARFDVSSRILIRADLVDSGLSGSLLRRLGSISTSTEKRQSAEDEAVAALASGQTVSMMPEGRLVEPEKRSESGVGPARPGLSRIAKRAGASVVPVAFIGTDQVWPRGGIPRVRRDRPTVTVRLGEPFEMLGDDDQANADEFMVHLGAMVRQLEAERA